MTRARFCLAVVLVAAAWLAFAGEARAADPGLTFPPTSEASDAKAGSLLFFNLYASDPAQEGADTRVSLTNTSTTSAAFVRLLFVDGPTRSVTGATVCLTATQTATFNMSQVLPGRTGHLVAVATDGVVGCPVAFNHLLGRADVALASGFQGSLRAIGVSALYNGNLPGCDGNSVTATLSFNGVPGAGYNLLPRVLALSDVPSRADARTLLVVNRVGGNLSTGVSAIGPAVGTLYDDAENAFLYAFNGPGAQLLTELSNAFPVTAPAFETVLPSERTGWTKLWSPSDAGFLGAALFQRSAGPVVGGSSRAGHAAGEVKSPVGSATNLHGLTLSSAASYAGFPVQSPSCSGLLDAIDD